MEHPYVGFMIFYDPTEPGWFSCTGSLLDADTFLTAGHWGGTCFGDSGGPVLVNDTNQIIAVVSYGPSATCHGADYSWRVDTQDSYDFILPFLDE